MQDIAGSMVEGLAMDLMDIEEYSPQAYAAFKTEMKAFRVEPTSEIEVAQQKQAQ